MVYSFEDFKKLLVKHNYVTYEDDERLEYEINVNNLIIINGSFWYDEPCFEIYVEPTEFGVDHINEADLDWFVGLTDFKSFTNFKKFVKYIISIYEGLLSKKVIFNRGFYYKLIKYRNKMNRKKENNETLWCTQTKKIK